MLENLAGFGYDIVQLTIKDEPNRLHVPTTNIILEVGQSECPRPLSFGVSTEVGEYD